MASRHAELLGEVEAAVSELRRVVLAGEPPSHARGAAARLTRAAGELVCRLDETTTTDLTARALDQRATYPVTKTAANESDEPGEVADQHDPETVKPGGPAKVPRRRVARPEPLDLDTVRVERIMSEAGETAGWRVLAGDLDAPIQVGTVKRGRRGRWEALNANLVEVPGGPWRSRQDAVVHLLDQHQRSATTRARVGGRSR